MEYSPVAAVTPSSAANAGPTRRKYSNNDNTAVIGVDCSFPAVLLIIVPAHSVVYFALERVEIVREMLTMRAAFNMAFASNL